MPWRVGGSGRRQESALTLSIYPQHIRQHEASHHRWAQLEARPGFHSANPTCWGPRPVRRGRDGQAHWHHLFRQRHDGHACHRHLRVLRRRRFFALVRTFVRPMRRTHGSAGHLGLDGLLFLTLV